MERILAHDRFVELEMGYSHKGATQWQWLEIGEKNGEAIGREIAEIVRESGLTALS